MAFEKTRERWNTEYAKGQIIGSHFPHDRVRNLGGYRYRTTPTLTGTDVAKELARHLGEYALRKDSLLHANDYEVAQYLWLQTWRKMLNWETILCVVRATSKRDEYRRIGHFFGYADIVACDGKAKDKTLIKLVRYVTQEGDCAGCGTELPFNVLTLDRVKPGAQGGEYTLANVQLMCQPCNHQKGDTPAC